MTNAPTNKTKPKSLLSLVTQRLRQSDMAQLLLLFFAVITIGIIATWPDNPQLANNSWAALAQSKLALLIFFATLFGALLRTSGEKLITLIALSCFHLFTLPLDTATYAASFPEVNFIWALTLPLIALLSYFMLGYFVSSILHRLHLPLLAIPCALALPIAAVFADIYLGRNIFNSFNSIIEASLPYIVINLLIGVIGLLFLFRGLKKETSASNQKAELT